MEEALHIWLEDQTRKEACQSLLIIRERAKCLYEYFVPCSGEVVVPKPFKPAKSLFASFKECSSLHNLKFEGETSSTDYESVE
jgi:hypothetical protein